MKLRTIYSLIFGLIGLPVAYLVSALILVRFVSTFLIFVFGDPLPAWLDNFLIFFLPPVILIIFICAVMLGHRFGKKREIQPNSKELQEKAKVQLAITVFIFILFSIFVYIGIKSMQ
jgi:hypothetical protein